LVEAVIHRENADLAPEEAGRQGVYGFLARVLARPVDRQECAFVAPLASTDTPLNQAFAEFRTALEAASEEQIERCYHDLFIGVGRGELLPYASYYLTGFLHEKPLAELRVDLERLGFVRAEGVCEPEDHIASLLDVMALLIEGTTSGEFDVYEQDRFFSAHIRPSAGQFFADLEVAKSADLYRWVGRIGTIFMGIEEESFGMVARA
jgi:TorA maturation chaperone TorD